jgi:hypothetical protein
MWAAGMRDGDEQQRPVAKIVTLQLVGTAVLFIGFMLFVGFTHSSGHEIVLVLEIMSALALIVAGVLFAIGRRRRRR